MAKAKSCTGSMFIDKNDTAILEWKVYFLSRRLECSNTLSVAQCAHHWMILLESNSGVVCIEADKNHKLYGVLSPQISFDWPKYETKRHIDTVKRSFRQIYTWFMENKLNNTIYHYITNNCQNYVNEFCRISGIKKPDTPTAKKIAIGAGIVAVTAGLLAFAFAPSKEKPNSNK